MTLEKLVFQIFDRKNRIIQQAKHQSELYTQHLASILAIDGIAPPSWLFTPTRTTSPKEISKDELISKLVSLHTQVPVCCSRPHYPLQVFGVTDNSNNNNAVDGDLIEEFTSDKGFDKQNCPSVSREAGCSLKNVSEEDQRDEGILSSRQVPQQSLVKIQRSKSRQKALELRSASKSLTRIGLSHRNLDDYFTGSPIELEGQRDGLPLSIEGRGVDEDGDKQGFGESACRSEEEDIDISNGRVTRSTSCAKAPDFVGGSHGSGCEPSSCIKNFSSSGAKRVLGSLDLEDHRGRDIENIVCAGNISGSEFSSKEAGYCSTSNRSSGDAQINHDAIRDFKDHLPAHHAHGSLVTGCGANVLDEQGDVRQSMAEDCQNEEEITAVPGSGLHIAARVDVDPHTLSHFDGANCGPLLSTSDRTDPVPYSPLKEPGLVESSFSVVHRMTGSKTWAKQEISKSECPITSLLGSVSNIAASVELLAAPCGQTSPHFHDTNDTVNEQQCADSVVDKELVLCNHVDEFVGSSPSDTNQRRELEYLNEGSSLNSSLFAEPKALDACDFTLTSSTSGSEIKRLSNMSEKIECSVLDPAKSIDKHASGYMNQLSVDEGSIERLSVRSKERAGTFDPNDMSQDNAMAGLNCERAEVSDTPHKHSHPVQLCVDQGHDSLPGHRREEENRRVKSMDKVSLESNAVVSDACRQSNLLELTNVEPHSGLAEEGVTSGLKIPNSDGSAVLDSWPRLKRRKIKHHESNRHTSLPSIGMKKLQDIQVSPSSTYMTNTEKDVETIDMGIKELFGFDFTELDYTSKSQNGEDRFCRKEQNKPKSSLSPSELSDTILVAGLTKKKAGNSVGLYVDEMETHSHIINDKQCSRHSSFLNENIAENTYHEKISEMDQRAVSPEHNDGAELQGSVLSPRNNPECNVVGQSFSVFAEFMVGGQSYNGELDLSADEIDFEKLKSPRNMLERASILAKICKSASTDTPLSDLSSALERASCLASLDMDTLPLNGDDVDKQHGFGKGLVNNVYSDCLPNYGAPYGWNPRSLSSSPVEKFWESPSIQLGSGSEKCMSTNPDLKCFRIEEDSCGSEENDSMDDIAESVQNDIDSSPANPCDSRQPLKEITNYVVPPVSTEPISVSLTTKPIVGATQFKVKRSLRKQTVSVGNAEIREKQTFSVGANGYGIKKDRESIDRSVNRPVLRSKSREEQKLPVRNSRKNNIVSHVNSFLPLVQQKQAAPVCAGKREVKVKALEAAEAAKRLEDRRQNERRIKKETLRSERAKLEEKNMREMELKKKKEAERKKKEDDAITKKRLREEEERKEEKKRTRVEASQRQREQEEKLRMHAKKAEKQKDHPKGGRKNNKPQVAESKNPHTMRVNASVLKDTENGRASIELAMHTVEKSPTRGILMAQTNQGKSYEISPYQCSDDEDGDEEELPIKKSIPSWASKSSVALLLALQQEMVPDAIFPPDSFCSMDDVLLHQKVK